jgi:hypothetical protein
MLDMVNTQITRRALPQRYQYGNSVPQSLARAIFWYQKAAADQNPDAQRALPTLIAARSAAAGSVSSPSSITDPSTSDDTREYIGDRIADLQSDIEEHETAAENWNNTIQQLSSSGCPGVAAADRAEIRRLQGQATATAKPLDQSFSGNLAQVSVAVASDPNAIVNAGNPGTTIVAGLATPYRGSARVVTSPMVAQSVNSNSSVGASAIQYSMPLATSCVRRFFDPNTYNWLSFENNCGQAIYINYIPRRPGGWAMGGAVHLAPGDYNNTGLSSAEIKQSGGFDLYVCPTDSVPVDLNGNVFNVNVAQYRCKPQ